MAKPIRFTLKILLFLSLITTSLTLAMAAVEIKGFEDSEKESVYKELIFELRCLVCQNQNLADSNAELAVDLRRQTYEMIQTGSSKQDVVDYMVARYGEFVLYRPPFTASTLLLWLGPFVFMLLSIFMMLKFIRGRKKNQSVTLTDEERSNVQSLLDE